MDTCSACARTLGAGENEPLPHAQDFAAMPE